MVWTGQINRGGWRWDEQGNVDIHTMECRVKQIGIRAGQDHCDVQNGVLDEQL